MSVVDQFDPEFNFALRLGVNRISYEGIITKYLDGNGTTDLPISVSCVSRLNDLKKIQHKHLCKYIEAIRAKNENIYIVTEHYSFSLQNVKPDVHLDKKWLKSMYLQCLSAVKHLANFDIVHGCIKPQDILITSSGSIKLSGYGIFYANNWCKDIKYPLNYPAYAAPEIFIVMTKEVKLPLSCDHATAHPPVDYRTDLWSLSVIFYELYFGRQVNKLHGMERKELAKYLLINLITNGQKFFLNEIMEGEEYEFVEFTKILSLCLTYNPKYRPSINTIISKLGVQSNRLFKEDVLPKFSFPNSVSSKIYLISKLWENMDLPDVKYNELEVVINKNISPSFAKAVDFINQNTDLYEMFHFWSLCGGDLEKVWSKSVMKKYQTLYGDESITDEQYFSHNRPPILDIPNLLTISENKHLYVPNNKFFVHESHWHTNFNKNYFQ